MTEKEALAICREKVAVHGLDMKLASCTISENENKTTFYFTSDGRVDFRELVKDLASVFHNRIELRQIGVRDEAKMLGGIGICGRPYCCKQFLSDFAPVSTKMAKVQSLSLNPTKISGSCGRLMCCLRYEEEAYEELVKTVPKTGAFVETPDGYGNAVSVDLLRQTVKVRLDSDSPDSLHCYKAKLVAAVPGGRPKDGEVPAHVLEYDPSDLIEEPAEVEDPWVTPSLFAEPMEEQSEQNGQADSGKPGGKSRRNRKRSSKAKEKGKSGKPDQTEPAEKPDNSDQKTGRTGTAVNTPPEKASKKPPKEKKAPSSGQTSTGEAPAQKAGGQAPARTRSSWHRHNRKKKSGANAKPQEGQS